MRGLVKIIFFVFVVFIIYECAHEVMPSGGPKDISPPVVLETEPENGSAHFNSDKFTLTFDEFIQLDNINQKVLISPPMKTLPEFKLRGKSLMIKFKDGLKPNTTYSVNFSDAITDLTEKNPLLNYTYIFSTGDRVDSMNISGTVVNAFDLKPVEDVSVMLYKDDNDTIPLDSMPFRVQPFYLGKTDANGHFMLNGLADEPYLIFALKDLNSNYIYDQPGEEIAFLDSLIMPQYQEPMKADTMISDSSVFVPDSGFLKNPQSLADSLYQDSLKQYESQVTYYDLFLFNETDSTQKLLNAKLLRRNTLRFAFSRPIEGVTIEALNFSEDTLWHVAEISAGKDTVTWFVKNLPVDTLDLLVMHGADTLDLLSQSLIPRQAILRGARNKRKKNEEVRKEYLGFKNNIKNNNLRLDKNPELVFDQPVVKVISDSILLVSGKDSTYSPKFYFADSLHRKIVFPLKLKEDTHYAIVLPDSSVIDWNGLFNKKKTISFGTKSLRDYGVFVLDLTPVYPMSYILQLMTEKEKVLREVYFSSDTTVTFQYLTPGEYVLKLIFDTNGNRKWDSGNYIYKIEPESVTFFPKKVTIRANWEVQEKWNIE